jgi:23S rRNA pseudouridine1911/1915/1917 synthase
VHRLDKDTSGVLVVAKTDPAHRALARAFAAREVKKEYLAVVHGRVEAQTIETHIVRDRGDGLRGSTTTAGEGERAVTHVRPVEDLGDYSLVECRLETGRTHQIRIHLSERGHLVCGDPVYRKRLAGPPVDDKSGAPRLALHAARLALEHPTTGERLEFETDLPEDLERFVQRLRRQSSRVTP